MSSRITAVAVAGALTLGGLAGAAHARVPTFAGTSIVTGAAIGGAKVGMTKKQLVAVWGKPDRCMPKDQYGTSTCEWVAASTLQDGRKIKQSYTSFKLRKGKVIVINLELAENTAIDRRQKRLKTSKKIRLGSKMSEARRKYGIPAPTGGPDSRSSALYKQGKRCTRFFAGSAPYEIESISVGLCTRTRYPGQDGGLY